MGIDTIPRCPECGRPFNGGPLYPDHTIGRVCIACGIDYTMTWDDKEISRKPWYPPTFQEMEELLNRFSAREEPIKQKSKHIKAWVGQYLKKNGIKVKRGEGT